MDGVVRLPSVLVMTLGSPPSMMATQELVVPRSMPMIFDILLPPQDIIKLTNKLLEHFAFLNIFKNQPTGGAGSQDRANAI
jgi:hypothetical protein